LQQWSPSRIRRLAQQQYAMLVSALELVRPGGHITYSTCALTRDENDGVIDRLFKKRKGRFQVMPCDASWGEETAHGRCILPDVCEGRGPMYICRMRRLA
jgi:16S rRNA C967 or C1407 C5-methylase (RsmB/RsmF family)